MVALAGPATNLALAIAGILILLIGSKFSPEGLQAILAPSDLFFSFWLMFCFINISLAIFNLIPLPPLDGFRLIKIISQKIANWIEQYTLYISLAFLALVVLGPGSSII